jgi:hypothetical protein
MDMEPARLMPVDKDKPADEPGGEAMPPVTPPAAAGFFDPEGRAQEDLSYFRTTEPEILKMMKIVRATLEERGLTVLGRGLTERDPEKVGGFIPCMTAEGNGEFYIVECVTGRMLENSHLAIRMAILSRHKEAIRWFVVPLTRLEEATELMRWIGHGWKLVPVDV